MKYFRIVFASFLGILFLSSCEPATETRYFEGPNERMRIIVEASRKVTLDPWMCSIQLEFDSINWSVLKTEVMADQIDSTNTNVRWINDSTAVLSFEQRDGSQKSYKLSAGNGMYHFQPISNGL